MKDDAGVSRRKFLTTAAGASGAALLGSQWLQAVAEAVDPRLAQVKRMTIAIDMHNHIFSGAAGLGAPTSPSPGQEAPPPLLLAEQLRLAGLTAVVAGYKIPFDPNAKPGETNVLAVRISPPPHPGPRWSRA